jgi:hypothetical protein
LRRLALAWWPSVVGAAAFMTCAQLIVMLPYPHSGAIAMIPAALYFAHGACAGEARDAARERSRGDLREQSTGGARDRSPEDLREQAPADARDRSRRRRAYAGLALSLGIGLLAGAPETFCFTLLAVAAYTAWLLATRAFDLSRSGSSRAPVIRSALFAAAAGLLGLAIAAVQVIPFLEYVANCACRVDVDRARACMLDGATWPLLVFPLLLGAPFRLSAPGGAFPPPNFPVAASVSAGGIVLLLAVVSLAWVRRSRVHAFFAVATVACAAYAYDLSSLVRDACEAIPVLRLLPPSHSHHVGVFGVCVCASFALDRLDGASASRRRLLAIAAAAIAFLALFAWGARAFGPDRYAELASNAGLVAEVRAHVRAMMLVFGAGSAVLFVLCSARSEIVRGAAWTGILALVFLSCGAPLRDYNPTIDDSVFFPRTPAIETLQHAVGDERVVMLDTDALPPDQNLVHRVHMLSSYDALWVGAFDALYREYFGGRDYWRSSTRASPAAMRLFGAPFLLAQRDWNPAASHFAGTDFYTRSAFVLEPLLPGAPIAQTFTATEDGLSSILVPVLTNKRVHRCTLVLRLVDVSDAASDGATVLEREVACENWNDRNRATYNLVVSFDPLAHSSGRKYELEIRSDDANAESAVRLWGTSAFAAIEERAARRAGVAPESVRRGRLAVARREIAGGLVFDWRGDDRAFRKVADVADYDLLELERPCPRYHRVEHAVIAASLDDAFERTSDVAFDATETVVLLGPDASSRSSDADAHGARESDVTAAPTKSASKRSDARVVVEHPTHIELDVSGGGTGYLVASIPWYPGWRAAVDGRSVPLLRADYAFLALELGANAKRVVLDFAPASFAIGAWISALASVACAALAFAPAWRARTPGA